MNLIYNIGIAIYGLLIWINSFFNSKAKLWVEGRKNIFKDLEATFINADNVVWFHCSSLGEFEQGKPLIKSYKEKYPNHKILLTFFSPSGYEIAKNYTYADWIYYLPLDSGRNSNKFIQITSPIKAIFIKYDFWFNYLNALAQNNTPIYFVSSIFRKNQLLLKSKWAVSQLKKVNHFFVQNIDSKKYLNNIGIQNITISGDTRFDQVKENTINEQNFASIKKFINKSKTIIIGSSWPGDENIILPYIKKYPEYKYIIAPHEINKIDLLIKRTNGIKYSDIDKLNDEAKNILIIDSIWLLSQLYKYADVAYIGGGFGKGIHNTLEAIVFGIPVIFGPNYHKSQEAKKMIELGIGKSIKSTNELEDIANYWLHNNIKSQCLDFISKNIGATKKILQEI